MGIFIKPLDRILQLERENTRLRALVGEAPVVEQPPEAGIESAETEAPNTLVKKTDDLETAVGLIAEVVL